MQTKMSKLALSVEIFRIVGTCQKRELRGVVFARFTRIAKSVHPGTTFQFTKEFDCPEYMTKVYTPKQDVAVK